RARHETLLIGVLDAQDELSALLTREEVVVEDRAHASDVQLTGGGRRETQPDGQLKVSLGRYSGSAWPSRRDATVARSRSGISGSGSGARRRHPLGSWVAWWCRCSSSPRSRWVYSGCARPASSTRRPRRSIST